MDPLRRITRLRLWLAGLAFTLAGRLHPLYDVWLDDALPRKVSRTGPRTRAHTRTQIHKGDDVERL